MLPLLPFHVQLVVRLVHLELEVVVEAGHFYHLPSTPGVEGFGSDHPVVFVGSGLLVPSPSLLQPISGVRNFNFEVAYLLGLAGGSVEDLLPEPLQRLRPRYQVHLLLLSSNVDGKVCDSHLQFSQLPVKLSELQVNLPV